MNIFKKIRRFVYYQRVLVYIFDVKEYNKSFQAKIPVWIGNASLDEIKELNRNQGMDLTEYPWEFLKKKIENGTWVCMIAKYEKTIVGYMFYSTNEMSFAGTKKIEFDLPPHTGYQLRCFVHPAYRNLAILKQLVQAAGSAMRTQHGIAIAFWAVNGTNKIQIHNCEKLGNRFVGSITFIKSKFFNKAFVSKGIHKAGLKIKGIYN